MDLNDQPKDFINLMIMKQGLWWSELTIKVLLYHTIMHFFGWCCFIFDLIKTIGVEVFFFSFGILYFPDKYLGNN